MKRLSPQGIIYQAPKKEKVKIKKNFTHFNSLLTALIFTLVVTLYFLQIPSSQTYPAQAYSQETTSLLLPSLLPTATPSPSVVFPFSTLPLDESQAGPTSISATATSSALANMNSTPSGENYCLTIPVILYHHIQPLDEAKLLGHETLTVDSNIFEAQISYLAAHGYNAVSADTLVEALLTHQQLPPKTIVITIDDGYIDNYTYAFMMAKKYKMIINFMIPTGLIGKTDYMTWDHLKEMALSPYARIYNHTTTHAALGLIGETQIASEAATANRDLETNLGLQNTIMTYPYGSYNQLTIDVLKKLGFTAAFTTDAGKVQCSNDMMKLKRDHIGNAPMSFYGY